MSILALAPLPTEKFEAPVGALELRATELEVIDQGSLELAAAMRAEIKGWLEAIEADCGPTVRRAHELHKDLVGRRKRLEQPFLEVEAELKAKCDRYVAEQRRIAAQRAAEEEVKARAAHAAAEAAARAARAEAEAEATALAAAGEAELADVVQEQAQQIVPPPPPSPAPPPPPPRAAGLAVREVWRAEVEDLQAFLVGVIEGTIPREAIAVNTTWLREQATRHKAELRLPGVRVWSETSTGRR